MPAKPEPFNMIKGYSVGRAITLWTPHVTISIYFSQPYIIIPTFASKHFRYCINYSFANTSDWYMIEVFIIYTNYFITCFHVRKLICKYKFPENAL